jgi:glycosyltransferase involved in cell wall biosynthesis
MNILLLTDPFIPVPPTHYGGIERVVSDLAHKYVTLGHNVTLVAGPHSAVPGRVIVYGENAPLQSISLDLSLLKQTTRILHNEIRHHDVLHNFGRLAWLFPIAWSGIRKVQTYMRYINHVNIRLLNAIGVRNIAYTGVSNAIVKTGRAGGGNWTTVYNCAPVERFDFRLDPDPAKAPLLFLGRLERCKGAHHAIQAAKLSRRQLIIAGNMSPLPEEKAYFETEISPLIDGHHIVYVGVVDDVQKNELLGRAAALLLPVEWYEPFPVVLTESLACGTPVIAFRQGGVPEGVRHGQTGFLCDTPDEMAAYIERLSEIDRAECRNDALANFSDDRIARDYLDLYAKGTESRK